MRKKNSLVVGLLALLTLGLYEAYWFGEKRQYLKDNGQKVRSFWLAGILPALVACDAIVSLYLQSKYVFYSQQIRAESIYGGLILLALFAVTYAWLTQKYTAALSWVTRGEVSSRLAILPFGLGLVGLIGMQTALNKFLAQNGNPPLPGATTPAAPAANPNVSVYTDGLQPSESPPAQTPSPPAAPVAVSGSDWQKGIATLKPEHAGMELEETPANEPSGSRVAPPPQVVAPTAPENQPNPAPPAVQKPATSQETTIDLHPDSK